MTETEPRRYVVTFWSTLINDDMRIHLYAYSAEDAAYQGCLIFSRYPCRFTKDNELIVPKHPKAVEPYRDVKHGDWSLWPC